VKSRRGGGFGRRRISLCPFAWTSSFASNFASPGSDLNFTQHVQRPKRVGDGVPSCTRTQKLSASSNERSARGAGRSRSSLLPLLSRSSLLRFPRRRGTLPFPAPQRGLPRQRLVGGHMWAWRRGDPGDLAPGSGTRGSRG